MIRKMRYTIMGLTLMVSVFTFGCAAQEKSADNTSQSTSSSNTSGTEISEDEAKKIALDHAKVTEADTTALLVKKEIEDGVAVYSVEFLIQNKEYDYEIKAADGTILSTDFDIEHDFKEAQTTAKFAEADAKKLVLEKVEGATEKDVQMKLETDDGRKVYEGKIVYNNMEYEFSIDAENGSILEWSEEAAYD